MGITLTTLQTVTRGMEGVRRRQALCQALGQMCRAIRIYLRKWERAPWPRISARQFSSYLFPLYACLARTWLPDTNPQVKLSALQALRPVLSLLLPRKEVQVQIHEDILLFAAQYQSGLEPFLITQILSQILGAALVNSIPIPSAQVEPLVRTLAQQIFSGGPPHRHHPQGCSRDNCRGISCLFLQLARLHPLELLKAFQRSLEGGPSALRVALLRTLAQIAGTQRPELWRQRATFVKTVRVLLANSETKVRLAMLQAIGQLLRSQYLENIEGWTLNYVSLQLAISAHRLTHPALKLPLGGLEEKAIERTCIEVLHVAVSSGNGASRELWGRLLGYLLQPHYGHLAGPLCCTLVLLAERRWQWAPRRLIGAEEGNSPTPQELMVRLLGLAVSPWAGSGRGGPALLLLSLLRTEMDTEAAATWWVVLPAMVRYLEGHSQYTLPASLWEEKLLEFLKASLQRKGSIPAAGWVLTLAKEFTKQKGIWPDSSAERVFLSKASGVALSAAGDPKAATLILQDFLLQADYADQGQMKGLRWCLAYCAEGHPAAVLDALGRFEAAILEEGEEPDCPLFGQGLPEPERMGVKAALMDFYGTLPGWVRKEQLRPPLLEQIVAKILLHYETAGGTERAKGDPQLALSFIRSLSGLSLAIQALEEDPLSFGIPQKLGLLDRLLALIQPESKDGRMVSPVCKEAMAALQDLRQVRGQREGGPIPQNRGTDFDPNLHPHSHSPEALSREENLELAEQSLSRFMVLLPLEEDNNQSLSQGALAALLDLMETLMGQVEASAWLQQVFQLLGNYLVSEREAERLLALQLGTRLLRTRRQKTGPLPEAQWGPFGLFVGALAPLTFDTRGPVRRDAAGCIGLLLSLQGIVVPRKLNGEEWHMRCIRQDLFCEDTEKGETASCQLAKVVSWVLPADEVLPFLCSLANQMGAVSPDCDRAALLWFEVAVQHWRMEPGDESRQVGSLVGCLCSRLEISEGPDPLHCLTSGLCVLAERHPNATCLSLLQRKVLPRRKEIWTALTTCKVLSTSILELVLNWMEPWLVGPSGLVNLPPTGLQALRDVILAMEGCAKLIPLLSDLCYRLLCRLSQEIPASCPDLRGAFSTCSEDPFLDGLLHHFLPPLNQSSGIFRDLSLAFCVELTEHLMVHKPEMRTPLLQSWLHEAKEGEPMPRAMAIRGLQNMANAMATSKVRTDPKLLETLLAELPHYLSSLLEEVQLEACKLAGVLLENMDMLCCETLDLEPLSQALRALTHNSGLGPVLTGAVEEVHSRCLECQARTTQASSRRRSPGLLRWFFRRQRNGRQQGGVRPWHKNT
ncbi:maestro heat-like repeat-containing protein family member 2A [Anolis sagrei]|uniref:maestro heat-like repeat-containing protein family member 2A n=1 Tax=Anolis sagrei TaxID=38937 RepID=UPI0035216F87